MFGLTPYNRNKNEIERGQRDIFDIAEYFDNFFNNSIFPSFFGLNDDIKVDIKENEKEYVVHADMPGVNKEAIKIDLHNEILTIGVVKDEQLNVEKENYIRRERKFGSFSRSFHVENVKEEGIKAKYDNGVLSVTLPKREPGDKRKSSKIEIE